jgi:hypothetical protein
MTIALQILERNKQSVNKFDLFYVEIEKYLSIFDECIELAIFRKFDYKV